MKNKNVLISAYVGYQNFGDEAIFDILNNELQKLNLNVTVLSGFPQLSEKQYGVRAVYSFDLFSLVKEIMKTDVLISGGGSILQDSTSLKSLIYYLGVIFLAKIFRKKVIIFAQGIGPLKSKISKFLVKIVLKGTDSISVRDKLSKKILTHWGILSNLVCDPFWSKEVKRSVAQGKVGIQLRKCKGLKDDFIKTLAGCVCKNFSNKVIEIFSLHNVLDIEASQKFLNYLKEFNPEIEAVIIPYNSVKDTIEKFGDLEYLIAMRFHAIVLGLKSGIKTLAINYDPKVKILSEEARIPMLDLNDIENMSSYFGLLKCLKSDNVYEYALSKNFECENFEKYFK